MRISIVFGVVLCKMRSYCEPGNEFRGREAAREVVAMTAVARSRCGGGTEENCCICEVKSTVTG